MEDLIKRLDPHLVLIRKEIDEEEKKLTLYVRMDTDGAWCPHSNGNAWSESVHSHYTRHFKDFMIMDLQTEIVVELRKFRCNRGNCAECGSCNRKTFAEPLSFAGPYARKTDRVWNYIDEIHSSMSAEEASEIFEFSLFSINPSTLIRHLKANTELLADRKVWVVAICLDDFAMKKRFSYGTAIIDAQTHELLELIPSRRAEDVTAALAEFPALQLVSRDGAACYKNGVLSLADGEDIIQILDPFHILMNCTEAAAKYLKSKLPKVLPLSGPVDKTEQRRVSSALRERITRIKTVQQLYASGLSVKDIAADQGLCAQTVRIYLKTDPDELESGNRQKFAGLLPYLRKISELLAEDVPVTSIYKTIGERGYKGCIAVLYEYVRARKAGNIIVPTEDGLSRNILLKRLYKPLEDIPLLDEDKYNQALTYYPFVRDVFEWVDRLRNIYKTRDTAGIADWLEDSAAFHSGAITQFVNGLKRDLDALKESIELPYSQGPMEGTVHKLKLIKRIMYGRAGFAYFRVKALTKERIRRSRQERLRQKKCSA